jgi:ubiquinone/menaquinone biosynthesis C-methylase UbiE
MRDNYLLSDDSHNNTHLNLDKIKELYNNMTCIWPKSDIWHTYTYNYICAYINKELPNYNITKTTKILNAGSAGNTYNIDGEHHHVDICYEKISHLKYAIEASIEELPYENNFFDGSICLGSVINYTDAARSIFQLARVIKSGGFLIFDFEQSRSLQFIFSKIYNKNAIIIDTFNSGNTDRLWVYSIRYILSILKSADLIVKKTEYFHILSSLAYNFLKDENKAATFAKFDVIAKHVPMLRKCSCNVILTCQKL